MTRPGASQGWTTQSRFEAKMKVSAEFAVTMVELSNPATLPDGSIRAVGVVVDSIMLLNPSAAEFERVDDLTDGLTGGLGGMAGFLVGGIYGAFHGDALGTAKEVGKLTDFVLGGVGIARALNSRVTNGPMAGRVAAKLLSDIKEFTESAAEYVEKASASEVFKPAEGRNTRQEQKGRQRASAADKQGADKTSRPGGADRERTNRAVERPWGPSCR